jgi:hypothetical protein
VGDLRRVAGPMILDIVWVIFAAFTIGYMILIALAIWYWGIPILLLILAAIFTKREDG